jgi:hypothetical protein
MQIAKWIILTGFFLIIVGILILLFAKLGVPLGKLPGDLHIKKEKLSIYFPIVTSIVISLILTVVLNVIFRFFK